MTALLHARRRLTALSVTLALIGTAVLGGAFPTAAHAAPSLTVTEVVGNLKIPWDLTWVGGVMLYDQRAGGIWSKQGNASPQRVELDVTPRVFDESEAGMLGMVADPNAASNKLFYTCLAVRNSSDDGPKGVEVWKWRLDSATQATRVQKLITGIPAGQRPAQRLSVALPLGSRRSTSAPAMRQSAPTRRVSTPSAARSCGSAATGPCRAPTRSTRGAARRSTSGATDIATSRV